MNRLSKLLFSSISLILILFLSFNVTKAQEWDLLWSYDISTAAGEGQAGAETDGMYLYTSFWDSGNFAKFDLDGSWIETFSIPGVESIKDLAFDGEFFYGSNAERSEPIYIMDFTSQSLTGNIPVSDIRIRHIAYDSDLDAFWCGNWQSDIFCVSRSGDISNTIPFSSHRMTGIYGSAYDNVSEGGPYLWLHSQNCYGSVDGIAQINIASGSPTGEWHNVIDDAGADVDNAAAGGLFNSSEILPGSFVLGGVIQGTPNKFFAYSLLQYGNTPPNLTAPENATYEVDVLPLFQWSAAPGVASYHIQVSLFSNFSELTIEASGITTLTYQATTPLEETTRYYWRVRGVDALGEFTAWSKKFSFITEGILPEPELLTPANEAAGTVLSPLFTWNRHIAASNYYLQVSATEDFSELIIDEPTLTSNRYVGSGLGMNTQYWWRVQMSNPFSTGDWSDAFTFTTGSFFYVGDGTEYSSQWEYPTGYGNFYGGAKQQFLIRAEELYAGGASPGFLTSLGFNVAQINAGTALQDYEIQMKLSTENELGDTWDLTDFTSVYFSDSYTPVMGWNVHEFTTPFFWDGASNLLIDVCFNNMDWTNNESCYWTECGYTATRYFQNDYNETVCTVVQWTNFSNYRPNMQFSISMAVILPPTLEVPLNNSVCISTAPLLDWIDVEGATSYTLMVAEDPDFYNIIIEETGLTNSEYQVPETTPLNEVTDYYWRVNATDDEGNVSFWSQKWIFTTEGDLNAPVLTSPFNGEGDLNPFVNLMWEIVAGAQQYQIHVATDEEFENIIYELNTASNQIRVSNLNLNTQYFWRVFAENECATSPLSEAWTFTIGNIPFVYGYNNWWMDEMMPGPVMFSLSDPGNMFSIAEQQNMDNIYSGTWAEGQWYGVTPWAQEFLTISTTTGERTMIGSLGVQIHGISYDVQSSTMFAVSYNDGVSQLYTVDMETGATTLVGPVGNLEINNLGCSADGDLYAVNPRNNNFYYIDKYTGTPTLIGPTGYLADRDQDIEFDNVNNICYWSGMVDYNGYLLTIDVETGAATPIGMFPNGLNLTSLAIPFTPACLDFPVLVEPANKSVCNILSPAFDWNDVDGALNYTFQLATSRAFDNIIHSEEGLLTSEFTLPVSIVLDNSTNYYWRVQAFGEEECNSYWSSKWSFVTEGELPISVLITPANGETDCMISPSFTWEANIGAANYYLQVALDEEFSDIIVDQPYITTPYYNDAELNTNTQYWWKVMMTSDCSEGEWSEVRTFTTGSSIVIGDGTMIDTWVGPYNLDAGGCMYQYLVLASEISDAGGIGGALTSLAFNVASVNSDAAAQDFSIRLKHTMESDLGGMWDLQDFTTVYGPTDYTPVLGWNVHYFEDVFVWDGVSNILVYVCFNNMNEYYTGSPVYSSLTTNMLFRMHDESGNPNLCSLEEINWWGATNLRPNMRFGIDLSGFYPPDLTSPERYSICNSVNTIFDWEEVANAVSYTLQVSSDPDFNTLLIDESEIEESEYFSEDVTLDNNSQYYWRVNAYNGEITSFWSVAYSFITEGETLPVPVLINPENEAEDYLSSFDFQWTGHIAASGYHLQVATDEAFEEVIINETNIPQTSYLAVGLDLNTQFYWRVMMLSPCSENEWSEIYTFTTGSNIVIGTGTTFNGEWNYPAAYAGESPGVKQQYLIRAEELINSGITAGNLTSIAFNVALIRSGNPLQNFTISLKHTTLTEFNWDQQWDLTGFNLVFGPVDYSATLGWNVHPFDNIFVWDGVSNIIVDICFNNYDMSYQNEGTYMITTTFNSTRQYSGWQNDLVCTDPEWTNIWNGRPNMAFGVTPGGLQPPRLISPANNAYNVSITPLFDWNEVNDAISYTLQLSTDPGFASLVFEQEVFDGTTYQVPAGSPLEEVTLYYWRLNSYDGENTSDWSNPWRFATTTPAPTLITPANGATGVPILTVFDWEDVAPDLSYKIQIADNVNFERILVDEIVPTSDFTYNFDYNSTNYWRVRVFSDGILSSWSSTFSFTTQIEVPWIYEETGIFATIVVPNDINPMIGDRPIENGDAIGLFYQREPGDWYCGGFGVWNGESLTINAWGDNPDTPIKDGFAAQEIFTFKIWDALLAQEWNAIATYQLGNDYYTTNGFSMLASLNAFVPDNVNISLNSGWNMASSYIAPENPNVEVMFASIVNSLNIMKNADGDMYIPAFEVNTIGNWVTTSGYLVNMFNNDMLSITGAKIVPEITPINLNYGWNLSAYFRDNEMSPVSALASIEDNLLLVKNNVGGLYIPIYGINTLMNMQPGSGYYIYMNEEAELIYPANSAQKADLHNFITPNPQHLIPSLINTGNNATLLLTIENNDGNEIGVFNENNELIGSGVVHNGIAAITIWGDNSLTSNIDGAKDNEYLNIKLYNLNTKSYRDISLTYIKEITNNLNEGFIYQTNAIYFAKATTSDENTGLSIKSIPNPVTSTTTFEFNLTEDGEAVIQIYNSTGELVANIARDSYSAGLNRVSFDATNLANGVYNIVLSFSENRVSSFMIVGK